MWMLIIIVLLASNANATACPSGCSEYNGTCACDQAPERLKPSEEIQPSNEKPPRSGLPSWQDPSVKADLPQSLIYQDAEIDALKAKAQ